MRVAVTGIRDKFEAEGTVANVYKKRSGRPRISTGLTKEERVQETFHQCPKKSLLQAGCELDISNSFVHRIVKRCQWQNCVPRLGHTLYDDDSD